MAKGRELDGLAGADRFAVAARRVVAVRAGELFEHAGGVLDTGDVERVHDMRVATRRLRAALEIFADAFDADEHRAVLRDVKRLADALGARRDPDVLLERLEALRAELPATDLGAYEALLERLRADQAEGNAVLAAALDDARERDLEGRLRALDR
jgi:CHAD domain-containing protein